MFSYLVLSLGGLLFGAMVYRSDGREREPWWMLVGAAVAGLLLIAGAFGLDRVIQAVLIDAGPELSLRLTKSLTSAPLQTAAKLAVPLFILLIIRKYFNDPMEGLIYGSLAGLGAAFGESVWYGLIASMPEPATVLHAQGPSAIRFMLHTVWGGIAGYALGLVVMKKPCRWVLLQNVGLVLALQVLWDVFLGFAPDGPETGWQRIVTAVVLGTSIIWYGLLTVQANKWSRSLHPPTSKQRLVGRIVKMLITRRIR
ncbi:MAG: PrsW family glutamic-type intramembrane protease [Phycisphaeraceae bacterium]